MKTAIITVIACLALACSTVVPPAIDIGVCTAGNLRPQISAITAQVRNCLGGEDFSVCLASLESNLTVTNGIDVAKAIVICAVREFTGVGAGSGTDPAMRERAKAYLNMKGIRS